MMGLSQAVVVPLSKKLSHCSSLLSCTVQDIIPFQKFETPYLANANFLRCQNFLYVLAPLAANSNKNMMSIGACTGEIWRDAF